MDITLLKAKIHRAVVTQADLDYVGSITIDSDLLRESGRDVQAVENCSMDTEKVYRSVEEIPDDAGYFSLIIAKERHD